MRYDVDAIVARQEAIRPTERYQSPRAKLAVGTGDHANQSRDEKIRSLVRMELHFAGGGDPSIGRVMLHPTRIIEAVDRQPHLPASGMYVRRITHREAKEARECREKPWSEKSPDERVVHDAMVEAITGVNRT